MDSIERCPLRDGGFYYSERIPDVCIDTCEGLWDRAVTTRQGRSHEEYPESILPEESADCSHEATEQGNTSLQAEPDNNGKRFYGISERCLGCDAEIAEDSFTFQCPRN
jgi:hypothetical protein